MGGHDRACRAGPDEQQGREGGEPRARRDADRAGRGVGLGPRGAAGALDVSRAEEAPRRGGGADSRGDHGVPRSPGRRATGSGSWAARSSRRSRGRNASTTRRWSSTPTASWSPATGSSTSSTSRSRGRPTRSRRRWRRARRSSSPRSPACRWA